MSGKKWEYRIKFSIERSAEGKDDFTEIGFGSSGAGGDVAGVLYEVESIVGNYQWETQSGMPDPEKIRAESEEW